MLEAMETDDFDKLPTPFYARSFLRKYAWAVELDEGIVLDAYDSGNMIIYDEVDIDDDFSGRRQKASKIEHHFYHCLFYPLCTIDFNLCNILCLELYSNPTGSYFLF